MAPTPPKINNSQTSLLIKEIQHSQPSSQGVRHPITSDILTKCIHSLRSVYHSLHTTRTLDTMFILPIILFNEMLRIHNNLQIQP